MRHFRFASWLIAVGRTAAACTADGPPVAAPGESGPGDLIEVNQVSLHRS